MDLKESFDRALDGGPAHRPIEDRLVVGRRAARRRRTAMSASVLATVLVLGGVGWAALPGAEDAVDGSVTTSPTNTPTPTSAAESPAPPVPEPMFAYSLSGAELETAPGLVVERRIDDPVERDGVVSSAAVATYEGKRWWVIAATLPDKSSWSHGHPASSTSTFEQWVRDWAVLDNDELSFDYTQGRGWLTLGDDGVLTPHPDVTIVEQTSPARPDQAPDGVPSATATIEFDGARICVTARRLSTLTDFSYLPESEYQGCGETVPGYAYGADAYGNSSGAEAP